MYDHLTGSDPPSLNIQILSSRIGRAGWKSGRPLESSEGGMMRLETLFVLDAAKRRAAMSYMRSLPGWLETRLAQSTLPPSSCRRQDDISNPVFKHICMCIYISLSLYIYIYMRVCVYIYIYIYTHIVMYQHAAARKTSRTWSSSTSAPDICVYIYTYICKYVCMCVHIYIYIYVCLCIHYIYI